MKGNDNLIRTTAPQKTKKNDQAKKEQQVQEAPMSEGDIRYVYTKQGLEVKRLSSRNWLVIDIFTEDVCNDANEKSYTEWMNKQREDDDRAKQKFPSKIYEKQLKELLNSFKKGPLTYETWARQSYETLLLKKKIARAKSLEEKAKQEKLRKQKLNEISNSYQIWMDGKNFKKSKLLQR